MIQIKDNKFVLNTKNTTYCFEISGTGHAMHRYYGKRVRFLPNLSDFDMIRQKREFITGNSISYDKEHSALAMEDECLEISGSGKGDLRSPFISLVFADGSRTVDFIYDSYTLEKGTVSRKTLPGSYGEDADVLTVSFIEKYYKVRLNIVYTVYEEENVITRYADLINEGSDLVRVERLLSLQLDLPDAGYEGIFFDGAWAREMHSYHTSLAHGMHVSRSNTGTSSNRANPFFMVARPQTNEDRGDCYAFNLIYSGNHMEITDANAYGKVRILSGISEEGFAYILKPGDTFEAPEAVMSYSDSGFNALSHNMHFFVREHIVRGEWKYKDRPILLNSWEAAYFKFDEAKLLKLAKRASDAGIELFVMDDGWFGERDDDTKSLGDWVVNKKKLPGGLSGLADKINKLGLSFGLWVEPEMVNVNSDLYEEHPDWCLANPKRDHSEGRNQRVLDLSRKEVREYIIDTMSRVFSSANIAYVKWDMNRIFSDVYSGSARAGSVIVVDETGTHEVVNEEAISQHQGEVAHRYVLGLYEIMGALTEKFPHILFEGCASGGNRFDLGILCYFPQIWASDNTDPICRAEIQQGYSYGYPLETMGAHVSASPNHQTLRRTQLRTRFAVAAFGSLGYECNLNDFTKEQMDEIKDEIAVYKKYREIFQHGKFFRGGMGPLADLVPISDSSSVLYNPTGAGNITEWTIATRYGTKAVGLMLKKLVAPNTQNMRYFPKGLEENTEYHFFNHELTYDIRDFGDLVNTVTPIHVKQDSLLMDLLAKKVKLPAETEDYTAYGSLLMSAGVALKQNFSGTGYNENVRYDQDFSGKLFFIEDVDEEVLKEKGAEATPEPEVTEAELAELAAEAEGENVSSQETVEEEAPAAVENTEEYEITDEESEEAEEEDDNEADESDEEYEDDEDDSDEDDEDNSDEEYEESEETDGDNN